MDENNVNGFSRFMGRYMDKFHCTVRIVRIESNFFLLFKGFVAVIHASALNGTKSSTEEQSRVSFVLLTIYEDVLSNCELKLFANF